MEDLSALRELYGLAVVVFGGALFAGIVFGWLGNAVIIVRGPHLTRFFCS